MPNKLLTPKEMTELMLKGINEVRDQLINKEGWSIQKTTRAMYLVLNAWSIKMFYGRSPFGK